MDLLEPLGEAEALVEPQLWALREPVAPMVVMDSQVYEKLEALVSDPETVRR